MARRERPLDPEAGPLPAFAYDLRKLREKAGTPTYRTLARKAGYSPATLSEAARGQRRPSLDVTLAYVGACGGDLDEWQLRWHDLTAAETSTDIEPDPPAPSDEPAPRPSRTRWRRWARRPLVLAAALTLVAATVTLVFVRPWAPHGCRIGGTAAAFTGQTYTFTRVRDTAELSGSVIRSVPANCTLAFSGYCLGDTVTDATSRTPDTRWFILTDGGLMASAVVHGNPPPRLAPSSCAGNVAPPSSIRLGVTRAGDELRLRADGEAVAIVGFTALDADGRWHQIGLTASPTVETRWRPDPPAPGKAITVAAVACLGGDGPTTVIDARTIEATGPPHAAPASLSGTALDAATRSACQYPDTHQ
jgi:transcriptional regulator with XRE-family HTH domain